MFALIDRRTLVLKMVKKSYFYGTKASMSFIPMSRMSLWCQIMKKMRLLYESVFVQIDGRTLILKWKKSEVFLMKPKHQYHLS